MNEHNHKLGEIKGDRTVEEIRASVLNRTQQLLVDALAGQTKNPVAQGHTESGKLDMGQYREVRELNPPGLTVDKIIAWEQKEAVELARSVGHVMGLTDHPEKLNDAITVVAARPELASMGAVRGWVGDVLVKQIKTNPDFVLRDLPKLSGLDVFIPKVGEDAGLLCQAARLRVAVVEVQSRPGFKMSVSDYLENCGMKIPGYKPSETREALGATLVKVMGSEWYKDVDPNTRAETESLMLAATLVDIDAFEKGSAEYREKNKVQVVQEMLAVEPDLIPDHSASVDNLSAYLLATHIDQVGLPISDILSDEIIRQKKLRPVKAVEATQAMPDSNALGEKQRRYPRYSYLRKPEAGKIGEVAETPVKLPVTPAVEVKAEIAAPAAEAAPVVPATESNLITKVVVGKGEKKSSSDLARLFTTERMRTLSFRDRDVGNFSVDCGTFTFDDSLNASERAAIGAIVQTSSFLRSVGDPAGKFIQSGKFTENQIETVRNAVQILTEKTNNTPGEEMILTRNVLILKYMNAHNTKPKK